MATLTAERTMLYCPKCQRKYEEGGQRFCNNDGGRLLPAVNAGVKRQNESKGVFTSLLGKTTSRNERDEQLSTNPRFVKADKLEPEFELPRKSQVFKSSQTIQPKIGKPIQKPVSKPKSVSRSKPIEITTPQVNKIQSEFVEKKSPKNETGKKVEKTETTKTAKPLSRLIPSNDINLGRAELGDRKTNPFGRPAMTWENSQILVGQTIKGRYHILKTFEQDQLSIAYLAEDKIREGKKVIVRVLMQETLSDDFQNKLLTEERVSLSHINHPNITKVFDSGELPEGKPFIVTEFVENESVKDYLKKTGIFNPMRTARIIRQSSLALSEVHQNGILHRNLQPQHLLLTVSESGNETVQVTDFCISEGKITKENFKYKSPEQINGQLPTFASDSYSLAVVTFQMLTNRLPFQGENQRELLKSQKAGLIIEPSNLNTDINPLVDKILTKALAYNPSDRYPKARDFGEAFFNALTTATPWSDEADEKPQVEINIETPRKKEKISIPHLPVGISNQTIVEDKLDISLEPEEIKSDIHIDPIESEFEIEEIEGVDLPVAEEHEESKPIKEELSKDNLWKKRSPEPTREGGGLFTLFSILGFLVLAVSAVAIWYYFNGLEETPIDAVSQTQQLDSEVKPAQGVDSNLNKNLIPEEEIESPPPPRNVETPNGFEYFENAKQNLSPELVKSYRGFSIAYPKDWKLKKFDKTKDKVDDKFLDVAKESKGGIPIESLLISPYISKGTFSEDKSLFPKLVEKSNTDISKSLDGNFEVVSEGETTIQNGRWKAYQVNFRTKQKGIVDGKEIAIWGRRLWIPVQRPGVEHGFIVTMLTSSLSDQVKSADDVGKTGDLARILETFEPEQNY